MGRERRGAICRTNRIATVPNVMNCQSSNIEPKRCLLAEVDCGNGKIEEQRHRGGPERT